MNFLEKLHTIPEAQLKHSKPGKLLALIFPAIIGIFLWFTGGPNSNHLRGQLQKYIPAKQGPSYNWPVIPFESSGPASQPLRRLAEEWGKDKRSHSLLIALGDTLLLEKYFNGYSAEKPNVLKSVCKLWISTLTGIAVHQGFLENVHQRVAELLPSIYQMLPEDDLRRRVTIEHLLTMHSGYRVDDKHIATVFTSDNWVADIALSELNGPPGESFFYSTPQTHLLAGALMASVKESLHTFAERELCRPLGIHIRRWDMDPQGVPFGGSELMLTSRDLLRLGTLFLKDGVIEGQRILPAGWVQASYINRRNKRGGNVPCFGYSWWMDQTVAGPVKIALGNGGQSLAIYPEREIMVVVTCQYNSALKSNNRVLKLLRKDLPGLLRAVS